jgi:Asp-tRNA(Asn)/Glu-tRNA(Gln) amidotransferase A subunit family amidase
MPTRFFSPIFDASPIIALDSTSVKALRTAGALIFGKTHTTQFASTTNGGPCANPHDLGHTPGGSSSGSAAAVADHHVPLALGTQTGGSIVRPASFCGVWGMKPTWGTVSTEGMARYSTTCDTVGYFARTIDDINLIHSVFTQRPLNTPHVHDPIPLKGKVAMLKTHVWPKAGPGLIKAWDQLRSALEVAGYIPTDLELPEEFSKMTDWHANLMSHESRAMFLGHVLADRDKIDPIILNIFDKGRHLTSQTIRETYDGIARLRSAWDDIANDYDLIITPSTTDSAPESLKWTGDACFNAMWTALHAPCVNVPGLKGTKDLPLGVTVVGARWTDNEVMRGAATLKTVIDAAVAR